MKTLEKISLCAVLGLSLSAAACTSRKNAAEAQTASSFEPSAEPEPTETVPVEPAPAAEPAAAPTSAAPGEDETWTDEEPTATQSTAASSKPAASSGPETRTMDVIRQFVLDRREKVRPCYDKAQAGRPNFKGDIMMRFVLSPSGTVQSIQYSPQESSLYAPDVGECIAREMKTWQFPASSRGMETKVGYPFNFNPRTK